MHEALGHFIINACAVLLVSVVFYLIYLVFKGLWYLAKPKPGPNTKVKAMRAEYNETNRQRAEPPVTR